MIYSRRRASEGWRQTLDLFESKVASVGGSLINKSAWETLVRDLYYYEMASKLGRLRFQIGINCPSNLNPISVPLLDPLRYGNSTITGFALSDYNATSTYGSDVLPAWNDGTFDPEEEFYTDWQPDNNGGSTANADLVKFSGIGAVRFDVDSSRTIVRAITLNSLLVKDTTYKISGYIYHEHPTAVVYPQIRYGSPTGVGSGFGQDELFKGSPVPPNTHTYFECLITKQYENFAVWVERNTDTGSMSIWYHSIKCEPIVNNAGLKGNTTTKYINEIIPCNKVFQDSAGGFAGGVIMDCATPTYQGAIYGALKADIEPRQASFYYPGGYATSISHYLSASQNSKQDTGAPYVTGYFSASKVYGRIIGLQFHQRTSGNVTLRQNNEIFNSTTNSGLTGTYTFPALSLYSHGINATSASFINPKRISCFFCGIQGSILSASEYDTLRRIMKDFHAAFGVPVNTFDQSV